MNTVADPQELEITRVREKNRRSNRMLTVIRLLVDDGIVDGHDMIYARGITRLAAKIFLLRREGWVIVTTPSEEGRRLANYILAATPGDPHYEYIYNYWLVRGFHANGRAPAN
jgi:hypothetical protein